MREQRHTPCTSSFPQARRCLVCRGPYGPLSEVLVDLGPRTARPLAPDVTSHCRRVRPCHRMQASVCAPENAFVLPGLVGYAAGRQWAGHVYLQCSFDRYGVSSLAFLNSRIPVKPPRSVSPAERLLPSLATSLRYGCRTGPRELRCGRCTLAQCNDLVKDMVSHVVHYAAKFDPRAKS